MTTASVKTTAGLERRMEVEVPAARVQQETDRRLADLGRKARIAGFRAGKVPASVIRQRFGEQAYQEALEEVMRRSFAEAVVEQKLAPAGGPRIEPISTMAGQDLKYAAVFEVYPEVKLQGLDTIEVERPATEVSDSDVDAMVAQMRKQMTEWKGMAEQAKARKSGDDAAAGAGETEAGKPETAAAVEPPSDEELCRSYGISEGGGMPELRREVEQSMRDQVKQTIESQVRAQVLEGLLKANPMDIPKALVDTQISDMQVDYARRAGIREVSQLPPREEFEETARRRVALGLLMGELIKTEKIKPDPAKVQAKLELVVSQAHNAHGHHHADPEEARQHEQQMAQAYAQNREAMQQIESMVLEDQAIEWLLSKAKTTERRKTFKELTNFGTSTA